MMFKFRKGKTIDDFKNIYAYVEYKKYLDKEIKKINKRCNLPDFYPTVGNPKR